MYKENIKYYTNTKYNTRDNASLNWSENSKLFKVC